MPAYLQRTDIPELLDDDLGTPEEIAASLTDLRRVNRWFGGISTTESLLQRVTSSTGLKRLSALDVGGATGESAAELVRRFRRRGVTLEFTMLDRRPSHLDGHFPSVAGDALELPFASGSFDVVTCALLVHHLSLEQLVQFVQDALRVARHAVLINDLRRSRAHLALVYAGMPLYRSRITRHDAPASVRRAYTPAEIQSCIRRHFANRIEISQHYLFRMGVIVWK